MNFNKLILINESPSNIDKLKLFFEEKNNRNKIINIIERHDCNSSKPIMIEVIEDVFIHLVSLEEYQNIVKPTSCFRLTLSSEKYLITKMF